MKKYLAAVSAVPFIMAGYPVNAQTSDSYDEILVIAPQFVQEGAVTSSKTDTPLIEVLQSVSVVTRDQIDLLNFIDVQQAFRYILGAVGENYGPDLCFDFVTIRGFTPVQYVDGLQAPVSASITNIALIFTVHKASIY